MIAPGYVQKMARYNAWQNRSLYGVADGLTDAARREDRGSFFKSIHQTLAHIRWADQIWMSRLGDWEPPAGGIDTSTGFIDGWQELSASRIQADQDIATWADAVTDESLAGNLTWYSGAMKADLVRPLWVCVVQLFNHQTHHRGQVHAMLTAAGTRPEDTDVPFMPEEYR